MNAPRRATIFSNGSHQVLRIPRDFELSGREALIHKEGERLIIEPLSSQGLLEVLATLDPLDDIFPDLHDPVPEPVDL